MYDGLYGESLPERDTFLRFQVYGRVRVLLVGKYDIVVCERT